jgi:DNA mismatch endonuclease (patch repair protein)
MGRSSGTSSEDRPRPFKRIERALAGRAELVTTNEASSRMARVRQRGTSAELAVRKVARVIGLRLVSSNRNLPGSPDLANRRRGIAIFVHGCFWHRHSGCRRSSTPKRNRSFWLAKFERNIARDTAAVAALSREGFAVVIVWECESQDAVVVRERILNALPKGFVPSERASSASGSA